MYSMYIFIKYDKTPRKSSRTQIHIGVQIHTAKGRTLAEEPDVRKLLITKLLMVYV